MLPGLVPLPSAVPDRGPRPATTRCSWGRDRAVLLHGGLPPPIPLGRRPEVLPPPMFPGLVPPPSAVPDRGLRPATTRCFWGPDRIARPRPASCRARPANPDSVPGPAPRPSPDRTGRLRPPAMSRCCRRQGSAGLARRASPGRPSSPVLPVRPATSRCSSGPGCTGRGRTARRPGGLPLPRCPDRPSPAPSPARPPASRRCSRPRGRTLPAPARSARTDRVRTVPGQAVPGRTAPGRTGPACCACRLTWPTAPYWPGCPRGAAPAGRAVVAGLTLARLTVSGLTMSRLTLSRLALARLAVSGLALTGLPSGAVRVRPVRVLVGARMPGPVPRLAGPRLLGRPGRLPLPSLVRPRLARERLAGRVLAGRGAVLIAAGRHRPASRGAGRRVGGRPLLPGSRVAGRLPVPAALAGSPGLPLAGAWPAGPADIWSYSPA